MGYNQFYIALHLWCHLQTGETKYITLRFSIQFKIKENNRLSKHPESRDLHIILHIVLPSQFKLLHDHLKL